MRRRRSARAGPGLAAMAMLAALGAGAASGESPAAAVADGPEVAAVEVRSDAPVDAEELRQVISIVPGRPLADEDVHRTLRALQASGVGSDLELETRANPDGTVVAVVVIHQDVAVSALAFTGQLGLPAATLRDTLPPIVGRPLVEDRLVRGVFRLEELLEERGYLDAKVRLEVRPGPGPLRASVTYDVDAGPAYRVSAVDFEGAGGLPRDALEKAMRAKTGGVFRSGAAREDEDRLRHFAIQRGFRTATVERLPDRVDPAAKSVALGYRFVLGPKVDLELVGATEKELLKKDLLPFMGDAGYDEALLLQSLGRIKTDYQSRGYYRVEIEHAETRTDDRLTLRLEIRPGERYTLDAVRFRGNETFPADRLARLLATAPRKVLVLGSGRLVDETLDSDLANLRSFYALEGFDRVRVGPPEVDTRGTHLTLTIPVVEGVRRRTADVKLEGVAHLDPARLLAALPLQAGGPYHRLLVDRSVDRLRELYEAAGYGDSIVSPSIEWNDDETVAVVTFRVLEGPRAVVRTVVLRGNQKTKSAVVRRFLAVRPGDPIHVEGLLETQRRLYQLGIFSRVSVTAPPSPEGAPADEVVVDVAEGKTRSVAYGLGYDTVDHTRVSLRLSQGNVGGRAASVEGELQVSSTDERYRLIYSQPYFGPFPVEVRAAAYREGEDRPAFDVRRRGVQLVATRLFGDLRAALVLDYRLVDLLKSDPELGVIPRENQNARVASLTPSFLYDRRDDPLNPTRGWSLGFDSEFAFPVISATADFVKLFSQATGYLDLGAGNSLAASLRVGSILPRGGDP